MLHSDASRPRSPATRSEAARCGRRPRVASTRPRRSIRGGSSCFAAGRRGASHRGAAPSLETPGARERAAVPRRRGDRLAHGRRGRDLVLTARRRAGTARPSATEILAATAAAPLLDGTSSASRWCRRSTGRGLQHRSSVVADVAKMISASSASSWAFRRCSRFGLNHSAFPAPRGAESRVTMRPTPNMESQTIGADARVARSEPGRSPPHTELGVVGRALLGRDLRAARTVEQG
jgi:hypothetical protein